MARSYKEDGSPAFQFFVDDWLSEAGLNLCSLAAQGLWTKMICYMWKAKIRGCLTANNKQMDSKDLATLTGQSEEFINQLLSELENGDVFSRLPDKTIICRRIYYKAQKERELKEARAEAGRIGGLMAGKQPDSKGDSKKTAKVPASTSTSSSTSISSSNNNKYISNVVEFFSTIEPTYKAHLIEAYPDINIDSELRKMKAWLISNTENKKKNFKRFANNWLAKSKPDQKKERWIG